MAMRCVPNSETDEDYLILPEHKIRSKVKQSLLLEVYWTKAGKTNQTASPGKREYAMLNQSKVGKRVHDTDNMQVSTAAASALS